MSAVRIKVCGLMEPGEARAVAEAGADWIGLNFHPASPRGIDEAAARAILEVVPPSTRCVGLFVDRPAGEVLATARRLGLEIVQLHGEEPVKAIVLLKRAGLTVLRAFRIRDDDSLGAMAEALAEAAALGAVPDAVLVDAFVTGLPGGTGRTLAEGLLDRLPPRGPRWEPLAERLRPFAFPRLILAGGLTPENVADRVARVRPWMVDVASGVERAPGRKCPERVAAFLRATRAAVG